MTTTHVCVSAIVLLIGAQVLSAQAPGGRSRPTPAAAAVELADEAARARGDRTEIAVLATAHLSGLPKDVASARFAPLIDALAAWAPRFIAIEGLSGVQCDQLRAYASIYEDSAKTYCPDPEPARKALGIDGPAAQAEIERLLKVPSPDRAPEVRRRLAALFLAMGEPSSALVQWLRLPAAERVPDKTLTPALARTLADRVDRRNENEIIAVPLAVRLGHERVWPVDDHTGDRAAGSMSESDGEVLQAIWKNPASARRRDEGDAWQARLAGGADLIEWYRWMNTPEQAQLAVASDFGAAAADVGAAKVGRRYLAYWETRNLRMVANIREVIGPVPGRRLLAIVGASHKAYYERYLGMTSDVSLVDINQLLGK